MATNTRGTTARELYTQQTHFLRANITYDGPTTVSMGYMPAGAAVVASGACVSIAFNAGTNNQVDIGITGDLNDYGDNIALGAKGVIPGTLTGTDNAVVTVDTEVFATLDLTGAAASAGSAEVFLQFLIP